MELWEKKLLQYLISQGVINKEQLNAYLQTRSKQNLKNWLLQFINEQQWRQLVVTFSNTDVSSCETSVLENNVIFSNAPTQQEIYAPLTLQRKTLGDYILEEQIGSGGMGVVYKAKHSISERYVALKLLKNNTIDEREIKRFEREVQAIASLQNEYIVQLYEFNQQPIPHFAMEYIEGITLKEALQKKLSYQDIAIIFAKVAEGLQYAHDMGIVHRDIKPENIILTQKNIPKIMDFGLAKDMNTHNSLSKTGEIMGTPAYLSPEQAKGSKLDSRTDIYSLGATLYHFLTGSPPFTGDSYISLFYDILNIVPIEPQKINNKIPLDLQIICMKCLEKEPSLRYQNMTDLAQDLDNYCNGRAINANKGKIYRINKNLWIKIQRRKLASLLICVYCVVLLYFSINYFSITVKPDLPSIFNERTRIVFFNNNLPYLLEYYKIQIKEKEEILAKKNLDKKEGEHVRTKLKKLYQEQAKTYYILRNTNEEYLGKALEIWQKIFQKSIHIKDIWILNRYICANDYESMFELSKGIRIDKKNDPLEKVQERNILQSTYSSIYQCYKHNDIQNIDILSGYSYGLWALAQNASEIHKKEEYLRSAILMEPKEENFYLELVKIYEGSGVYDASKILSSKINSLNDFLLDKNKQIQINNNIFYDTYKNIEILENHLNYQSEKLWQSNYNFLQQTISKHETDLWICFVCHNYSLRLLALYRGSQKSKEFLNVKAHFHFAQANNLIKNHFLTYIYMGNYFYQNRNFIDALVHWDQAKKHFPGCEDWLLECENMVVKKIEKEKHHDR